MTMTAKTTEARLLRPTGRDHRIDLIRGLALAMIFINHMPGNWLENWTSRNFGFSDAAEVFVLLAGYAAALAFNGALARGDVKSVALKATRRAGELYVAHLVTTLLAVTLFVFAVKITDRPEVFDLIGILPIMEDPVRNLGAVFAGGLQLSYFNILPMYVVLLLALPGMIWLAARDLRLLAAASAGFYALTNIGGVAMPSCQDCEAWFFNPLAWQALFVGGLLLGFNRCRGRFVPYSAIAYVAALVYVIAAGVWTYGNFGTYLGGGYLPPWAGSLHKSHMPLTRLLHVFALAYVVCYSPLWGQLARVPKDLFLTRMGRHSLPVFMAGSVLSMAGWIVLTHFEGGIAVQTALVAIGLLAMAWLAAWVDAGVMVPATAATRAIADEHGTDISLRASCA